MFIWVVYCAVPRIKNIKLIFFLYYMVHYRNKWSKKNMIICRNRLNSSSLWFRDGVHQCVKSIWASQCMQRFMYLSKHMTLPNNNKGAINHLGGGPVVKAWDQEVCSLCGLKFEPCGCSYDSHWRLTWSLTSGPVGLVEVRASWPGHPR